MCVALLRRGARAARCTAVRVVVTKPSPEVESRRRRRPRLSRDPHGLPHTTDARRRHSAQPTECRRRANQPWQAKHGSTEHRPAGHLLRHVFRRRAAACAEVGNWASIDRIGVWRAGTYHISTVCHVACIGSSQRLRQIDRSDQHAYRGAAFELPMVPEARHGGHSRSAMVPVRPVLSTTIMV